jgi:hypothetical protein
MEEQTVGEESVSTVNMGSASMFTVVQNPRGEGYVSRFYFERIDLEATGPVRDTADECILDCLLAIKGMLNQLGIEPGSVGVTVAAAKGPE